MAKRGWSLAGLLGSAFLLVVLSFSCSGVTGANLAFTRSTAEINNPGRGWYTQLEMSVLNGQYPLTLTDLVSIRDGTPKQSLVLRVYWLIGNSTFPFNQGAPLPASFLKVVANDFNVLRQAGMKAVVRIGYTNVINNANGPYNDAPLSVASAHIDQLSPIFKANADVIFTIQAGFIGTWAEWYYTDYYGGVGNSYHPDRKALLDKLLSSTSPITPIAVRTPAYKYGIIGRTTNLTPQEAYSGSNVSRLGFHNDCFLASYNDQGTFIDAPFEYPYLGNETKYTSMGGETCEKVTRSSCYSTNGGAAMTELARFHYKYLNLGYNPTVISTWKTEGCYTNITQRLGYRLLLSPTATHSYTNAVRPGRKLDVNLVIENEGFAAPLHKVNVFLLLLSSSTTVWAKLPVDARFWLPEQSPFTLQYSIGVGYDVPEGTYKLGLQLADALFTPTPASAPQPRYAIQLANLGGLWNATTGWHDLGGQVTVSSTAADTGAPSSGLWFGRTTWQTC